MSHGLIEVVRILRERVSDSPNHKYGRNMAICLRVAEGSPPRQVARQFGISPQRVNQIVSKRARQRGTV